VGPAGTSPVATPDEAAVAVGEIVGAHSLRGLVRLRPYQLPAPSLVPDRHVILERAGVRREARLLSVSAHTRGVLLVGLDGVTDRTAAEALAGTVVLVRRRDLPPLAAGEFYHHEIVGFAVETEAGEAIGTIAETMSTGLNDVWVVRDGAREHLIPVIADVVRSIDREAHRIVIAPMPGLLD
jgi:16S rRNA processing protein RimM